MIFLYADLVFRSGGIETYLHALATHLAEEGIAFRVAVSEQEPSPVIDELAARGIDVYRQSMLRGDRWHLRKRALNFWLKRQLAPGDWVFCVRQPMPELYLGLVRAVHARGAHLAASWIFAPESLTVPPHLAARFAQAVRETDAVISVAQCTAGQFKDVYGYTGPVQVVPYHNIAFCAAPLPLPPAPPFRIAYMGRIEIGQKNLDTILRAFTGLARRRADVELHVHGGGPDEAEFTRMVEASGLGSRVQLHGPYDHRRDLRAIVAASHLFVYSSRFEGGPCLSLLELLQAGRYVVTSPVGGIPDIYARRPDLGVMVDPDDLDGIVAALEDGLRRIAAGAIDQAAMRAHYEAHFNMAAAHRAWIAALGIGGATPVRLQSRPPAAATTERSQPRAMP